MLLVVGASRIFSCEAFVSYLPFCQLFTLAVAFNQCKEFFDGLFGRYVLFNTHLAAIQAHFAAGCAHIAVVGIGHFAGSIYNATHDADFQSGEVSGCSLDARNGARQVVERTATAGAADVFGFRGAQAGGLQNAEGGGFLHGYGQGLLAFGRLVE